MVDRRNVVRLLEANGFKCVGGAKHDKFVKRGFRVIVPRHREIKEDTFKTIRKQAGL